MPLSQEDRDAIDFTVIERQAAMIAEELKNINPHVELDAREFGEHIRNGGWRLGLLVARSVQTGVGQGRPSKTSQESCSKMSARAFSKLAKMSSGGNTAKKFLDAWNMAAADGHVPPSDDMTPGQEFDFDSEIHTPISWDLYFKPHVEKRESDIFERLSASLRWLDSAASLMYGDSMIENMEMSCSQVYNYLVQITNRAEEMKSSVLQMSEFIEN